MTWPGHNGLIKARDGRVMMPKLAQRPTLVAQRIRIVRLERQRRVKRGDGFAIAFESEQHIAAAEMRLGKLRIDHHGALVACERILVTPEVKQRGAAVAPALQRLRRESDRPIVAPDRLCR